MEVTERQARNLEERPKEYREGYEAGYRTAKRSNPETPAQCTQVDKQDILNVIAQLTRIANVLEGFARLHHV